MLAVEHQGRNKILGSSGFSLSLAEAIQKLFITFRPDRPPLTDWPGTFKGHGPFLEKIQIMIRIKLPFIVAVKTVKDCELLFSQINGNLTLMGVWCSRKKAGIYPEKYRMQGGKKFSGSK